MSHGISKITEERNQHALMELVSQPGNDICADCKTRNPRWASYSLGIFICVHCASIHRKMGTHISKVKSLTLDTWTREQVMYMRQTGNVKSNQHYNPDETRHPPPANMMDQERDSDLEKYIRSKYQYKSFVSRSAQVAALLGPSRSTSGRLSGTTSEHAQTTPLVSHASSNLSPSSSTLLPTTTTARTPSGPPTSASQTRVASQPVTPPLIRSAATAAQIQPQRPSNQLWNDLAQLQVPATNTSLPLQYATPSVMTQPNIPQMAQTHFSGLSVSPNNSCSSPLAHQHMTGMHPGLGPPSMGFSPGLSFVSNAGMGMNSVAQAQGFSPGMVGMSSAMAHQPTPGGLSTSSSFLPRNTTPSPNSFSQSFAPTGFGMQQQQFAPFSYGQGSPFQSSPMNAQGFPMPQPHGQMASPQMLPSQMLPPQMQMQPMQGGDGFFQPQTQAPFAPTPSPVAPFVQTQQMLAQPNPFGGGTGWQQQTGYPGQQQQWSGM